MKGCVIMNIKEISKEEYTIEIDKIYKKLINGENVYIDEVNVFEIDGKYFKYLKDSDHEWKYESV